MRVIGLLFAKPPRPGEVKTRLAEGIGHPAAAAVAAAMIQDTWRALSSCAGLESVLATPEPQHDHGLGHVDAWDQGGGDLGARVERMLRRALGQADAAMAVGADGAGVPAAHYRRAIEVLGRSDAALGPTTDGGFYLLGLRRCPEGLLRDLPWSDASTGSATRLRLLARGLSVGDLPEAWDVDDAGDLRRLRREVARADAPCTHAAIDALGWP